MGAVAGRAGVGQELPLGMGQRRGEITGGRRGQGDTENSAI